MYKKIFLAALVLLLTGTCLIHGYLSYVKPFVLGREAIALFNKALDAYSNDHDSYPVNDATLGLNSCHDGAYSPWIKQLLPYVFMPDSDIGKALASCEIPLIYYSDATDYVLVLSGELYQLSRYFDDTTLRHCPDEELFGYWTPGMKSWCPGPYQRKIADLSDLKQALEKYHALVGKYPESVAFDGVSSRFGLSTPEYIKNLVPLAASRLPVAPKGHDFSLDPDYLYRSDGADYKLVMIDHDDCLRAKKSNPGLADPGQACRFIGYWTAPAQDWEPSLTDRRMLDLAALKAALERFHAKFAAYPKNAGFAGLYASQGALNPDWIAGLAPQYIAVLPRDPRRNNDPANQYLYAGDGADYKLIAHNPEDCDEVKRQRPDLIDPVRDCRAYGYWTTGAKDW